MGQVAIQVPHDAEFYLQQYLQNPRKRTTHFAHVAMRFLGSQISSQTNQVQLDLHAFTQQNPGKLKRVLRAVKYVADCYTSDSPGGFQAFFFPFTHPNVDLRELRRLFESANGMINHKRPEEPDGELLPVRTFAGRGTEFRVLYAQPRSSEGTDPDTGYPTGKRWVDKHVVVFRKSGVEIRAGRSVLRPIEADLRKAFEVLTRDGFSVGIGSAVKVETLRHVERISGYTKSRLRIYKGVDPNGECSATSAEAYLEKTSKHLRDLQRIVKLKIADAKGNVLPERANLRAQLGAAFRSAEIEFDYLHPDGFLEESVKVTFDLTSIKFVGKISEPALDHFWEALLHARRS